MKKSSVSILFDAEKLSAVKMYMSQRDLNLKDELEKSIEAMYSKYVPSNVREYIQAKMTMIDNKSNNILNCQKENIEINNKE